MTNHDMLHEGSHRTFRQVWRDATIARLADREAKAERKARSAGVEEAHLRAWSMSDRLLLEARGWELEATVATGNANATRWDLKRSLTSA